MPQFVSINPRTEVKGETIISLIESMETMKSLGARIAATNEIDIEKPKEWYPQQNWLKAFKEIFAKVGSETLFSIGKKTPEKAVFPPAINSIEKALASIDIAYHMNHRIDGQVLFNEETGELLEGIGHYFFKKTGEKCAEIVCDNPYPCDYDSGIIHTMAKKFQPDDAIVVTVAHDKSKGCRKNGDPSCTYIIKW